MKERSWAYAKTLFLILSINLFLCTDIVECTERVLTVVNHILSKKGMEISILNPTDKSDYKFNNGIKFLEMSAPEKDPNYIANFLQYIYNNQKTAVFLEIIFTMDESWEKNLFEKMKSTDEAIIFTNLGGFLEEYEASFVNFREAYSFLSKHSERLDKYIKLIKNNKNIVKAHKQKRCYVITSKEKVQILVNIIEKGIIEVKENYDFISYSFNPLYPKILKIKIKNAFNLEEVPLVGNKKDYYFFSYNFSR